MTLGKTAKFIYWPDKSVMKCHLEKVVLLRQQNAFCLTYGELFLSNTDIILKWVFATIPITAHVQHEMS